MIPVDANTALQRHKWLAVAINKLRHKNSLPETSRNGFELEIPQQVADVAAGMCWALSPEEYEDLRMSTTEVLEFMEPDLRYEQHRFNSGILPKWIDVFLKQVQEGLYILVRAQALLIQVSVYFSFPSEASYIQAIC